MRTLWKGTIAALGAAAMLGILAGPALAQFGGPPPPPNTGVPFHAKLTGWAERPATGDARGTGQITVVVDPPKGQVCYMFFDVHGIARPTAAHIHRGGPEEAGPPVVTLEAPEDGTASGCAPIAADLAQAMVGNPGGYYVNVHNAMFPGGALRGQLMQ
jgi:hypothetical protein